MSIHLDCPICNQRLNIPNKAVGRLIQCVACGSAIRVPDPKAMVATETVEQVGLFGGLRLQLAQIGPRSSEFIAQRPVAALGMLFAFVLVLIGLKFARAPISDFISHARGEQAAQVTGPVDPEPWPGVGLRDENDHVRVVLKTSTLEQITVVRPSVGVKRKTQRPYLKIVLEIQNLSATEKLHYSGWGVRHDNHDHIATMKDNAGVEHRQPESPDVIVGQYEKDSIEPNGSIEDILVFDLPLSYVKYLKMSLPAEAVGGTGLLRIKIPHNADTSGD
jgi:hypothetical protein